MNPKVFIILVSTIFALNIIALFISVNMHRIEYTRFEPVLVENPANIDNILEYLIEWEQLKSGHKYDTEMHVLNTLKKDIKKSKIE